MNEPDNHYKITLNPDGSLRSDSREVRLARAFKELDAECERLKKELNFSKNCTGVVVRPTQAMMEAGAKALADYICRKVPGNDNTAACAVYAAMLAAAQEQRK